MAKAKEDKGPRDRSRRRGDGDRDGDRRGDRRSDSAEGGSRVRWQSRSRNRSRGSRTDPAGGCREGPSEAPAGSDGAAAEPR